MDTNELGLDDDFMGGMLADFLDESQSYLGRLNENLLKLDEMASALGEAATLDVDGELLNEMFRDAHSLKGLSAMLQLDDINSLTHKIENVFDAARSNSLRITRGVVDVMFQAFDQLTAMVEDLKSPSGAQHDVQGVVDAIREILVACGAAREQRSNADVEDVLNAVHESASSGLVAAVVEQQRDPFENVVDETEIADKYLSIFIDETAESLDALSEFLLHADDAQIDPLLVVCHRIKGGAAAIGLNRLAKLAHSMEDLLQDIRDGGCALTAGIADALLTAGDAIRHYVESLKAGHRDDDTFPEAYATLRHARGDLSAAGANPSEPNADDPTASDPGRERQPSRMRASDRDRMLAAMPSDARAVLGIVVFAPQAPLIDIKARLIQQRLVSLGTPFFLDPSEQQIDEGGEFNCLLFGLTTELDVEDVRQQIDVEGVTRIALEVVDPTNPPAVETTEPTGTPSRTAASSGKEKPAETLRVDIERLDNLMNLAGQLVINKARFGQIGERLKEVGSRKHAGQCLENVATLLDRVVTDAQPVSSPAFVQSLRSHVEQIRGDLTVVQQDLRKLRTAHSLANELTEAVHQLDRVADGIQKSVMDTRMVPIGPLFGRFKRVVRDITRDNGKQVQLVIRGEKTELDKRMIDELSDPLIHMVRNAADHGIELPEEREAAGKRCQGTVTLDAFHRGNRIFIQVRDDGRGLDVEKLRTKAISKGIVTAADAERLSEQQVYQLIWEPGFSTAEKVTEVSGRGMGMDIVRSKIEQINGAVEIESEDGAGTTITIKLPLTMAILPSLLTVIAHDVFAIPVESVIEIVRVRREDFATVHGKETANIRGRVISVVELAELFSWNSNHPCTAEEGEERTLVIVGTDGDELGLAVDALVGEADIVIKTLDENFQNVEGLAGASILGDGRVSLILDVAAMLSMALRDAAAAQSQVAQCARDSAYEERLDSDDATSERRGRHDEHQDA